jgi:hypothetical protein
VSGPHDATIERLFVEEHADPMEIAARTGITHRSVMRALQDRLELIPKKPRPARHAKPTPEMIAMLEDGASYGDVAETFHVGRRWLSENAPGYGWNGVDCGSLVRLLNRSPEIRRVYNEIQRMPLDA